MFNISTCWNIEKHEKPEDAFKEIADFGFDGVELSWINEERFAKMKGLKLKVGSVHSYMPEPMQIKEGRWRNDVYRLTALDEEERKAAVACTLKTLEVSAGYGAKAVVVHLGIPEGYVQRSSTLFELFAAGKMDSEEFVKIRAEIMEERDLRKDKYFDLGLKSLEKINTFASRLKLKIGVETRFHYEELPGIPEFEFIFREFRGGSLGYWHDIGHAESQEKLGFLPHDSYLNALKGDLIGMHIHDMKGLSDHMAPGTGELKYNKYIDMFKDSAILKVFEVHPFNTKEQVLAGRKMLEQLAQ